MESWDQLVHSMLHPAVLLQSAPESINTYLVTAKELKEGVRTQLLRDTLYNKTEKETELLVERYQIIVASLLDLLFHYQHYESITREAKQFYQQVAGQLEAIILFLQNHYGRYFNANLSLPIPLRLREAHDIKKQWKIIAKRLSESETNTRLITILDQSIKGLLHLNEETDITYHQVSYFKNLLKEISGYLSTTASPPVYASIIELLICCKFNELAFIREVCNDIRSEMEKKESSEFRLEFLRNCQKQVSQLWEQNHAPFHTVQPAAKQMILDWLSQDLAYLELPAVGPEIKEAEEVKEGVKIHTSLSVPVLALITRLFKDSGIVTNTNHLEIIRFFATHFTTQRKSEFSFGHLRSKYYEVDESTKKKVYDYLMQMAQLCKKM
jgi:hypothetical protein